MLLFLFTKTPLVFFIQSFWRDEAFSYFLAKKNIVEIISLTAKDFNPPLYYLLLHFWVRIFGGSEIALRSLSLIFYWATIYVVFLFLNKVFKFDLKKSFLYLILVAVNPLLVYYAFEARMYTMFAFSSTLSFYLFYQKKFLPYLVISILGLYTHYFMIFVILAQLVFILLTVKKGKIIPLKYLVISMIVFLPWLTFILITKPLNQSFWIEKPPLAAVFNFLGIIFFGYEASAYIPNVELLRKIVFFTNLVLVFALINGIVFIKTRLKKSETSLVVYLIIWSLVLPILIGIISFFRPIYLSRYLIFSSVGFLIFIIFILDKLKPKLRVPIIIALLSLTYFYQKEQIISHRKTDLKKTIKEIKLMAKKNDKLYVTSELDFMTAQYYFSENQVYIFEKTYEEIPDYVGKILISPNEITNRLPIYPNKAFILNSDGSYEIKAIY